MLTDQERVLICSVRRTTVFDHSQPPCGELIFNAVVKEDNSVRNIFFQAMPGKPAIALLGGDDRCDIPIFQPAEQAA